MPSTSASTNALDVGVDADLEEEHRDEEVADRARARDGSGRDERLRAEREAGDERADDRRQLGGVGQLGERRA